MPKKKTAAPTGIGNGGSSTRKISTRSLKHNPHTVATVIAVFDDGRFMGLRHFESRAAARVAMRQGVLG